MKLSPAVLGATILSGLYVLYGAIAGQVDANPAGLLILFVIFWVISFVVIKVGAAVRRWLGL